MSESRVATGNIIPSSFVKLSTTKDGQVTQCGAGDQPFGIAQKETRYAPFPGLDDGNCAIATENLKVFTFPDKEVYMVLGTGGATPGSFLKSDSAGKGVISTGAASPGEWVGAISKGNGNAGDLVPVDPIPPFLYAST